VAIVDQQAELPPCMLRGYLQMTGIDMLTHIKPA
jgi:hypothetical protein